MADLARFESASVAADEDDDNTGSPLWTARWLATVAQRQETTLFATIVVVGIIATTRNSAFLDADNLVEIVRSSVIYFVAGCGTALLLLGGGLDFSVGATFTLGALSATLLMQRGLGWPLAFVLGVLVGAAAGVANHLVITYLHVPPIIATIGTFFILSGVDSEVSQGNDVLPLPAGFNDLGQNSVAGVPIIVIIAVVLGVVTYFALELTPFGTNVRAVGGNRGAAIGNGLRTVRLDAWLYLLAGGSAAFAGILQAARVGAGQVEAGGTSVTLSVFTAVLIGGVSLFGGLGTITGVAVGALLLSTIDNALIVANISPQYNPIIVGIILIVAVAVDYLRRQRLYRQSRR